MMKEISVKFEFSLSEIRFLKLVLGRVDEEFELVDSIKAKLNGTDGAEVIKQIVRERYGR